MSGRDQLDKGAIGQREESLLENTVIVFTSDHGDLRGEHHRQNKGVPYEGSTRIPFLFYFPGKINRGLIVNQALTSIDFMPTVLTMASRTTGSPPQSWRIRH